MSTDDKGAAGRDDEATYSEKPTFAGAMWDFANKPFSLWLLTTILIGLTGFAYTNYATCRTAVTSDEYQLMRLYGEFYIRTLRLAGVLDSAKDANQVSDAILLSRIGDAINPDKTFAFLEFKGRTTYDILAQMFFLEKRWKISPTRQFNAFREVPDWDTLNAESMDRNANYFRSLKLPSIDNAMSEVDDFQIPHSCLKSIFLAR